MAGVVNAGEGIIYTSTTVSNVFLGYVFLQKEIKGKFSHLVFLQMHYSAYQLHCWAQ